jgi:phosphohistidine phosphatase
MRRLLLLRHAEAVALCREGDKERALSEVGHKDASRIGDWLASNLILPDLALVSEARRARETFAAIAPHLPDTAMHLSTPIYNARADELLALVKAQSTLFSSVLLVGHNPGFEDLARLLCGYGDRYASARLMQSFPPAALAILDFDVANWQDVAERGGRLDCFVTPAG